MRSSVHGGAKRKGSARGGKVAAHRFLEVGEPGQHGHETPLAFERDQNKKALELAESI